MLKNNYVIVQQNWLKDYFKNKFNLPSHKVIVNPFSLTPAKHVLGKGINVEKEGFTFIYPTKALSYKNIDVILEAALSIETMGINNFELIITIDGTENRYARNLYNKFKDLKSVKWLGTLSRGKLEDYYAIADCLIFPSKLETWGLPISEFKTYQKPVILADLPYAHETVGSYPYVKFFDPDSSTDLTKFMLQLIKKEHIKFDLNPEPIIAPPVANNWQELFQILLKA